MRGPIATLMVFMSGPRKCSVACVAQAATSFQDRIPEHVQKVLAQRLPSSQLALQD